jgi:hypothetical protein
LKRFSVGNTTDQEDAYRGFQGRQSDAIMRARGFDSFKAEIKIIENGIQFNKKSDLNFKSLFYIYKLIRIILKQLF